MCVHIKLNDHTIFLRVVKRYFSAQISGPCLTLFLLPVYGSLHMRSRKLDSCSRLRSHIRNSHHDDVTYIATYLLSSAKIFWLTSHVYGNYTYQRIAPDMCLYETQYSLIANVFFLGIPLKPEEDFTCSTVRGHWVKNGKQFSKPP